MGQFDYLRQLDVTEDKTAELQLISIVGVDKAVPVLIGKPANEANKSLLNAVLKRNKGGKKSAVVVGAARRDLSAETLDLQRDEEKPLYAEHVLVGWKHIPDMNGEPVEFTPENAKEFLESLPDWIFEDIRQFFQNPMNFLDEGESLDGDEGKN
jgi:hypothetical protein